MPAIADLAEKLRGDDIHLNFQAASVVEAIPLLLRPAMVRRSIDRLTADEAIAAAIQRENDTPTRCGPLGLPHARSRGVREFILALGANPSGVIEGQPQPRLVFAFVSPEERREEHLQLLAALARLSQNEWIVEKIAGAANADEVFDALRMTTPSV